MSVIGQENLKKFFDRLILQKNVPRVITFIGSKGQGKKTFANHLISKMGSRVYVPDNLKVDDMRTMIEDALTLYERTVYLIADADSMTVQAQNALLKFIEEPPPNATIIFTVEDIDNLLPTIQSRSQAFFLESYTKAQLREATDDLVLLNIFENIGQIERAKSYDIEALLKTTTAVTENISSISTANTFNILKHFEVEDADLFLMILIFTYHRQFAKMSGRNNGKTMLANQLREIYRCKARLSNKSINKQNMLEMLFVKMQEVSL